MAVPWSKHVPLPRGHHEYGDDMHGGLSDARMTPEELVRRYAPQRALLVERPPTGEAWVHELKLDGYRVGGALVNGTTRLASRRGNDLTQEFPEISTAIRGLRAREALVDGEVVVLDERGRTSFQALQNRASSREGLTYFLFDLVWLDGQDVSRLPLEQRKALLRKIMFGADPLLRISEHFDADGREVYRRACQLGAEGVVSKRRDAAYQPGLRNATWQKSKCALRQEFVVGGFTDPTHASRGLGSLLIGYYDGPKLIWAGKVSRGHGFTERFLQELRSRLERSEQRTCPFEPGPPGWLGRNAHWVRPELVAEISFSQWTKGGQLRHATLEGFRSDKTPGEVTREVPLREPPLDETRQNVPHARGRESAEVEVAGVRIKNPSALVFPTQGLTRLDLVRFYEEIGGWALSHVRGRPLTLVRCREPVTREDALRSQCEFLHHAAQDHRWAPSFVPRLLIPEQRKTGEYLYVDSIRALIALFAGGVVELHTWNARVEDYEHPDRVVFDIDRGDDVAWQRVIDAAHLVRLRLEDLGLESWPKMTGGSGLHVVVPFRPELSWKQVFAFSRAFAEMIAGDHPGFTTSFSKADRVSKILIDYKRNYRTSIAVAAFSPRAKPNAAIAVPLGWREITARLRPGQWTMKNLPRRLTRLRADPWGGYWRSRQRLTSQALERVGAGRLLK